MDNDTGHHASQPVQILDKPVPDIFHGSTDIAASDLDPLLHFGFLFIPFSSNMVE
jgi:hypothetical protein